MRILLSMVLVLAAVLSRGATQIINGPFGSPLFTLQSITTNAWSGYSMARRLSSTYSGAAFQVLRDSDLATQDIGFVNGTITDTNSLLSFIGTNSGFLVKLYDQSGNARNLTTNGFAGTTFTNGIEYVVIGGVLQSDIYGRPVAYNLNNTARDIFGVGYSGNMPITSFFTFTSVSHTSGRVFCCMGNSTLQLAFGQTSLGSLSIDNSGTPLVDGTYTLGSQYLATLHFATNSESVVINIGTATTGTSSVNNFSTPNIGDAASGASADSKFSEWIIYNNDLSAGDTATLQNNINAFYSIWNTNTQSTLNDSLISYWKMDESSGNALDAKDGDNLTDNATVTTGTGIINGARFFTAANSEYFSIADNAQLSVGDIDFTWTCWVNFSNITALIDNGIFYKGNGTATTIEYFLRYLTTPTSLFQFGVSSDGGIGATLKTVNASNFGTPTTNTWYFVVAAHDSVNNLISIQVNNGTANTTSTSAGVFNGANDFVIGRYISPSYWYGLVDEVGFWKRILTAGELTTLYGSGAPTHTCCPFTP